jgi:hypothetical protein
MTPATGIAEITAGADWDAGEVSEIRSIAAEIESCPARRRRTDAVGHALACPSARRSSPRAASRHDDEGKLKHTPPIGVIRLALSDAPRFSQGMRSTFRALIVRQLLEKFGFDEHRVFRWRLEHKLTQALLLNHYAPGSVPATRGLLRFASKVNGDLRRAIEDEFPAGYVIKESLGHSSGERGDMDRAQEALSSIGNCDLPHRLWDEPWLLQQRIPIEKEYRVHSLEDGVIPDLTFHRFGAGNIPGERDAPNQYVERLLSKLPDAVVGGSLLAWDIALTSAGELMVIEVNFSGYHPVNGEGFQCSGYYQDVPWGASNIARLLRFVEDADGLSIDLDIDVTEASRERDFYGEVIRWREMLRNGEYE